LIFFVLINLDSNLYFLKLVFIDITSKFRQLYSDTRIFLFIFIFIIRFKALLNRFSWFLCFLLFLRILVSFHCCCHVLDVLLTFLLFIPIEYHILDFVDITSIFGHIIIIDFRLSLSLYSSSFFLRSFLLQFL
jgi:hypothetical protein